MIKVSASLSLSSRQAMPMPQNYFLTVLAATILFQSICATPSLSFLIIHGIHLIIFPACWRRHSISYLALAVGSQPRTACGQRKQIQTKGASTEEDIAPLDFASLPSTNCTHLALRPEYHFCNYPIGISGPILTPVRY